MGSEIQANEMVEFEDGLWIGPGIGNQLRAQDGLQRGSSLYLGLNQEWYARLGSSEVRLNSNLLRSTWLPGVKPGTKFDSQQPQYMNFTLPREIGMFVLFLDLAWKMALPSTPTLDVRQNFYDGIPLSFHWEGVL